MGIAQAVIPKLGYIHHYAAETLNQSAPPQSLTCGLSGLEARSLLGGQQLLGRIEAVPEGAADAHQHADLDDQRQRREERQQPRPPARPRDAPPTLAAHAP